MVNIKKLAAATIATAAIITSPLSTAVAATIPQETPLNVVVIFADDMGWGDVGYHGYDDIMTPSIDKLANNGVWFEQGYVSASVCGPSRIGMLTGVHQQKMGIYGNSQQNEIPREQRLIFELMQNRGYRTGVIGKWHLGDNTGRPNERGVDFFYGFHNGSHSYIRSNDHYDGVINEAPIYRNDQIEPPIQEEAGYLTEMFSQEAVEFINESADEPFFLYMAYNAVHSPWQVPPSYIRRVEHLDAEDERKFFAGMVLALDDGIGDIMGALKENGLKENTMVFFLSDNGTPRGQGIANPGEKTRGNTVMSNPGHLNGFKGDTYEGGIRVPFLFHWPSSGLEPGTRYDKPVSSLDIVPTIMGRFRFGLRNATGLPFDGVDLMPHLTGCFGPDSRPHQQMFWRRGEDYAIRDGDWKLTVNDQSGPETIRLFNLADDSGEWNDLVYDHLDIAQRLKDDFDAWDSVLPDNKTGRNPENRNYEYHLGVRIDVREYNQGLPDQYLINHSKMNRRR